MSEKVHAQQIDFIEEETEQLAIDGLRTLVFAQKVVTEEDYSAWRVKYNQAKLRKNWKQEVVKTLIFFEKQMEFLGLTGILDRL